MENISPVRLPEVIEPAPKKGTRKQVWCAYVFDQETGQWDMKVYFKKAAIPHNAIQVLRCQMYKAAR